MTAADGRADLDQLGDLRTPWCLRVVVTLGIPERLAAGTAGVEDLAAEAGCDADALHRVLSHLVERGVFAEPVPGRFELNDAARGLLDPARRLGLDLAGIGGRLAGAWATLPTYVRTGSPGYRDAFGLPFWDDLEVNPDLAASFDALIGPAGHGTPDPDFPLTGGWASIRTVVDVGGGTGAMLAEILRVRARVHGILVDLPRTVARAGDVFDAAGVSDRAAAVGRSFFEPLPEGADLYLLRGVLNDWPDREAVAILARCAQAARPGGRVVVLKGLGPDDGPRPVSIEMVLLGGRTRTVGELTALADEAGLDVVATGRQASGPIVVECRPRAL